MQLKSSNQQDEAQYQQDHFDKKQDEMGKMTKRTEHNKYAETAIKNLDITQKTVGYFFDASSYCFFFFIRNMKVQNSNRIIKNQLQIKKKSLQVLDP